MSPYHYSTRPMNVPDPSLVFTIPTVTPAANHIKQFRNSVDYRDKHDNKDLPIYDAIVTNLRRTASWICVNTVSCNDLLPEDTKPLHETMLVFRKIQTWNVFQKGL